MTADAPDAVPPGHLVETVTSLEMFACPPAAAPAPVPPPGTRIERVSRPGVPFYRFLYDTVGEPWLWAGRRRWSDATLEAWLHDPRTELWVLSADGQPAGFAELDRRVPEEVELSYFGLLPAFIGRRLGPPLLRAAIHHAFAPGARRLWVHTCDFDHPAALGLYRREGFAPFRTHRETVPDPRATGLIGRHVQPERPVAG